MKLSVIMPVYNEKDTIEEIIDKVLKEETEKELIIVDDGSSDGTQNILKKIESDRIKVIFHNKNRGKGAAIKTAINHICGDIILIQDADLEYSPTEYKKLIEPIIEGKADVVYGSRFLGGPHRVLLFWHFIANVFITMLFNLLYNVNFTDIMTCYKAFRKEAINDIEIKEKGFGVEIELSAKFVKKNLRIYEIPISYYGRTYKEGKKIKLKDAFVAFFCIFKYKI